MSDDVDGQGTLRTALRAIRVVDGQWIVVNDEDGGALCRGFPVGIGYVYYEPIAWLTFKGAQEWIMTGTVGELQERTTNLNIGFRKGIVDLPQWKQEES